jgi:hypothetical protein
MEWMHYLNETRDKKLVYHHRQNARKIGDFIHGYQRQREASSDHNCRLIDIKVDCKRSRSVVCVQPLRPIFPEFTFF